MALRLILIRQLQAWGIRRSVTESPFPIRFAASQVAARVQRAYEIAPRAEPTAAIAARAEVRS